MDALRALGVRCEIDEQVDTTVTVVPPSDGRFHGGAKVFCGLAGTVMRFVPGLAMFADGPVDFDGDEQAYARPMKPVLDGLEQLGACIEYHGEEGRLPFTITPPQTVSQCAEPSVVSIDSSGSSQFISGLLLIGSRVPGGLELHHTGEKTPSLPHIRMTVADLQGSGVRANADEWHVDPKRVCIVGFSAGGMVCASLATQWKTGPFAGLAGARPEDIRPDAVVLGYPLLDLAYVRDMQTRDPRIDLRVPKTGGKTGRDLLNDYLSMVTGGEATDEHLADICPTTHVSRQMPPTFVWGVSDDKTAPIAQVYPFAQRMAEEGVACEMHVFDQGGHGLSLGNANTAIDNEDKQVAVRPWIRLAFRFLERHM